MLDEGFDQIYERVREELNTNKDQYQEQIQKLQELIRSITAESNSIQAEEQRNYQLAQRKFSDIKKQIREVKVSQYYRNMTKVNFIDAQFMDNKK